MLGLVGTCPCSVMCSSIGHTPVCEGVCVCVCECVCVCFTGRYIDYPTSLQCLPVHTCLSDPCDSKATYNIRPVYDVTPSLI